MAVIPLSDVRSLLLWLFDVDDPRARHVDWVGPCFRQSIPGVVVITVGGAIRGGTRSSFSLRISELLAQESFIDVRQCVVNAVPPPMPQCKTIALPRPCSVTAFSFSQAKEPDGEPQKFSVPLCLRSPASEFTFGTPSETEKSATPTPRYLWPLIGLAAAPCKSLRSKSSYTNRFSDAYLSSIDRFVLNPAAMVPVQVPTSVYGSPAAHASSQQTGTVTLPQWVVLASNPSPYGQSLGHTCSSIIPVPLSAHPLVDAWPDHLRPPRAVGFDCEMVQTTDGLKAAWICLHDGAHPLLLCHILQAHTVTNYCSRHSGVYPRDLKKSNKNAFSREAVVRHLHGHCDVEECPVCPQWPASRGCFVNDIIVGHAVWNDFNALACYAARFVDTQPVLGLMSTLRRDLRSLEEQAASGTIPTRIPAVHRLTPSDVATPALRVLAAKLLGECIQLGSHSPEEDARTTLRILLHDVAALAALPQRSAAMFTSPPTASPVVPVAADAPTPSYTSSTFPLHVSLLTLLSGTRSTMRWCGFADSFPTLTLCVGPTCVCDPAPTTAAATVAPILAPMKRPRSSDTDPDEATQVPAQAAWRSVVTVEDGTIMERHNTHDSPIDAVCQPMAAAAAKHSGNGPAAFAWIGIRGSPDAMSADISRALRQVPLGTLAIIIAPPAVQDPDRPGALAGSGLGCVIAGYSSTRPKLPPMEPKPHHALPTQPLDDREPTVSPVNPKESAPKRKRQ